MRLPIWAKVLAESTNTLAQKRERVDKVLKFFVKVGTLNKLGDTFAVTTLKNVITVLAKGGDGLFSETKIWTQLQNATKTDYISTVRNLSIHGIPLFNIWDCIAFIYTVCVEDICTSIQAQLYLYQFRLIVTIPRRSEYFPSWAQPTTVAATWTASSQSPLTVAFATTCVGSPEGVHESNHQYTQESCT